MSEVVKLSGAFFLLQGQLLDRKPSTTPHGRKKVHWIWRESLEAHTGLLESKLDLEFHARVS